MNRRNIIAVLFLLAGPAVAKAQYEFYCPPGSFAIEASLESTKELRMPMYRNAMTSLIATGDYVLGGTTSDDGLSPLLFTASLSQRRLVAIKELEAQVPGQQAIGTGFSVSGNSFYAGTMPQSGSSNSGHIVQVQIDAKGQITVSSVAQPVPGEGVFALTFNRTRNEIYGIAHPSGKFFMYDVKSKKTQVFTETAPSPRDTASFHSFALAPKDYLCRALVIDKQGRVYGSRSTNKLFSFDPATKKFTVLKDQLPFVWGREVMGRIDAWVTMPDGTIYGSNAADGQLFRLDVATQKIINLGKPIMMPRLMTMVPGKNGMLYGIAGAAPGYAHLFSYHPKTGFRDLGNPEFDMKTPGLEQGIKWRGYQISTITATAGGQIVMGENEALSQLMVFPAENQP
ncbi:MAG: hypothetical protein EOO04_02565 [Chitinophagaceae bacterium]|nr:MAG: hypothetical protein EOO04_02565 [Chitinophagaceae bacterium]